MNLVGNIIVENKTGKQVGYIGIRVMTNKNEMGKVLNKYPVEKFDYIEDYQGLIG